MLQLSNQTTNNKEFGINIDPCVDYYIFTDGSGYTDGFGGFSTFILNVTTSASTILYGGQNNTSVPRQEFKALLEGLQYVCKEDGRRPLTIVHYCDCESLVKALNRVYGRNSNLDLWYYYDYYESILNITSNHVMRENDIPALQLCDLHASSMRTQIKEYNDYIKIN